MFFCGTIRIFDDDGAKVYEGPSFIRCKQHGCREMVTNGYLAQHGACYCGGRRFQDAVKLKPKEIKKLKRGEYPLNDWERAFIRDEIKKSRYLWWWRRWWDALCERLFGRS